jgi:hypothetical protein
MALKNYAMLFHDYYAISFGKKIEHLRSTLFNSMFANDLGVGTVIESRNIMGSWASIWNGLRNPGM